MSETASTPKTPATPTPAAPAPAKVETPKAETTKAEASTPAATPAAGTTAAAPAKKATGGTIQNGKGDAPRNISPQFRQHFDEINWAEPFERKEGTKFKKVYK